MLNQDLIRQRLSQRARELVPILRERALNAAQAGQLPEETLKDFHDAGFFRILQPSRWEGYELEPKDFFDVQMTLAEGCMSLGLGTWRGGDPQLATGAVRRPRRAGSLG